MKKFNLKGSLCGFMAGVLVATAVPVMAYNGTKTLSATFKNIKIYIDGAELTPRDSAGNVLEPFIYNGSTYLPIRAVGEAVGKTVSYDANTNSVYLGSSSGTITTSSGTKLTPYDITGYGREEDIVMGGKEYSGGFSMDPLNNGKAYFNITGNYSTVSGLFGNIDGKGDDDCEGSVKFYGDGILLKEYTVKKGQLPQNFTLNISGVSQFVIETDDIANVRSLGNNSIGFAELYIK